MVLDLLHNFVEENESFEPIDPVESHSAVVRHDSAFQHLRNEWHGSARIVHD